MSDWKIEPLPKGALADAVRVLQEACTFDKAHLVAEEKLFGEGAGGLRAQPLGAYVDGELVGVAAVSDCWLRLLAILPEHRERGIGSGLLQACLERIKSSGRQARIMDQPGNYLSPGIDKQNAVAIAWLEKRGFSAAGQACSLVIALGNNERVSEQHFERRKTAAQHAGYTIQRLEAQQLESSAALIEASFSVGWAFEFRLAAKQSPPAVHVAVQQSTGKVVAFAVHDGNNQGTGSFGPAGTLEEHRGQGLGAALLLACLLDIRAAGLAQAEVAWIGPREFYDKIAGIESERYFTTMTKDLKQEDGND